MSKPTLIENLSTVALVIVGLLVVLGTIRLVLSHWSYALLTVAVLVAAYYIYTQSRAQK
jgi:hypothetical protein